MTNAETGPKIISQKTCNRCGGSGVYGSIGTCFGCHGTGIRTRYAEPTREEMAERRAAIEAERKVEDEARRARLAARKAARLASQTN